MKMDIRMYTNQLTSQPAFSALPYLAACALHNAQPDEQVLSKIDINLLFGTAQKQSLSSLIYIALQNTDYLKKTDTDAAKTFKDFREQSLRKSIITDAEKIRILAELEERHIWYMPLKGSVLKHLYPREDMREMTDIDILYDGQYRKKTRDVFISRGYSAKSYGRGKHDVYTKSPVYVFEMHSYLFAHSELSELYSFFDNINEMLIPDEDNSYGRHLSNEDFYLYMTAHSYRHYVKGGHGLRPLVDFYVMNNNWGETMNWEYVKSNLHRMKIADYEKTCRCLANHLFSKAEPLELSQLPQDEQKMLSLCFAAGTKGTEGNKIVSALKNYNIDDSEINRTTKIKYYIRRIFPGRKWFRDPYPFFYRFPFMIPFFWIYRIIKTLLFKRAKIKKEIETVESYNYDDNN